MSGQPDQLQYRTGSVFLSEDKIFTKVSVTLCQGPDHFDIDERVDTPQK